jgi:glycopeptide antibiotics resistance protein
MQEFCVKRNRIIYAAGILTVILLGLASRSGSPLLPALFKEYAGDTLWALAAYLSVAFIFSRLSIWKVALIAGLISLSVELSQLYHADWIDHIRQFRLGGLLLGYGFLWSDLICYLAGISIGVLIESYGRRCFFCPGK